MGGDNSSSSNTSSGGLLQSYAKYLPGLVGSTAAEIPTVAQNQLNSTIATQPLYNALNLQQAQNYALPLAQVGQQVQDSNAQAGAMTNLRQLLGAGGASAIAANQLNRIANPVEGAVQDSSINLLNSQNLKPNLSGGELSAIERGVNQGNSVTGNLGVNNATNTTANAMMYGNAAYQRQQQAQQNMNQAINTTNGTIQTNGFNPAMFALGQPNPTTQSNFGTGTFTPTNSSTQNASTQGALGFGSGVLGNMTSANNTATSANASMANANSAPAYLGAICCFIFLEAYHGKLPTYIRSARDHYYLLQPNIATGYRRMSCWLVPAMKASKLVRWLTWQLMIGPISNHLAFVHDKSNRRGGKFITHVWLKIWSILGKNYDEKSFCKPWMYPVIN